MAHGRREDAGCLDRPQARAGPCAPQVALLVLTRVSLSELNLLQVVLREDGSLGPAARVGGAEELRGFRTVIPATCKAEAPQQLNDTLSHPMNE